MESPISRISRYVRAICRFDWQFKLTRLKAALQHCCLFQKYSNRKASTPLTKYTFQFINRVFSLCEFDQAASHREYGFVFFPYSGDVNINVCID